jgi:hypothetical protein
MDNQTPLHIALQKYIQNAIDRPIDQLVDDDEDQDYQDVKCVIKELLFNGANRSFLGKFNLSLLDPDMPTEFQDLTPLELMASFENRLPVTQF